MAKRGLLAMTGPAGQESGQEAASGAIDAVEDQFAPFAGDGLLGGDLVALEGDPGDFSA